MGLEILVPLVMGALLKVAGKVADGALSAVEDAAADGASGIFAKIKSWWSGDSSASGDLERFTAEPEIYQPVVEARLISKLADDPAMQAELAALLQSAGPGVDVFQSIATAHGVTGAKVEQMLSGRVTVRQEIKDASSNVVGADIKRLGQ
ncbi:hypothetical protein [Paractinoplanes atraurantiacus]|uniref:Uncharacterized protein n=1 Tax=Paractinoplanes atraurantiacus TaxID=1036182 RepID=A0A285GIZ9_9ACTN|nr:hypothetical protein [Actinoplanes atraurantiacus]SNY23398.1 hypothetical protein SAMN05421748_10235 [Actinoplanes atraurantiacus]